MLYVIFSTVLLVKRTDAPSTDVFCISVVKHGDLITDELAYLLTEFAGDADVERYADRVFKLWARMAQLNIDEKRAIASHSMGVAGPGVGVNYMPGMITAA